MEVVVDARILCRRLSERRARPFNQVCPERHASKSIPVSVVVIVVVAAVVVAVVVIVVIVVNVVAVVTLIRSYSLQQ